MGGITKIREGILAQLSDASSGRRSIRWLAQRSGIPYSTLQQKLSKSPDRITTADLVRIADALGKDVTELWEAAA